MSKSQQTQEVAKEDLKVLEKQQNNLNETLDKVLEIGENATDQNAAKACNKAADNLEKRLDVILAKMDEKKTKAGVSTDATANAKK